MHDNTLCPNLTRGLLLGLLAVPAAALPQLSTSSSTGLAAAEGTGGPFQRIASFPVFLNTSVDEETVAEIVAAANGGNTLVYTDSQSEVLGFVDITDPAAPKAAGAVALPGEPTSVAVKDGWALTCVNTSLDFVNTSGELVVVDVATQQLVHSIALGGQPDAIAVSPDGHYAAIAIENERDEDLGDGEPPQLPAGFVVIVDLDGAPANWTTRVVDLVGVPDLFPEDPEPEFVDINAANIAVVTLQENNHIVLINLASGAIVADYSAGDVGLRRIDTVENDLIEQVDSLRQVPREPDGVAWTSNVSFVTADEGDLFGGSREFTVWQLFGAVAYTPLSQLERLVARLGHYPEGRSENKGNEPEGVEYGSFDGTPYLFVGSERSNVVTVFELFSMPFTGATLPVYRQTLPTGVGPEGLLAIPGRDLFVAACEVDARDDKIRSTLMVYARTGLSTYPTVVSADRTPNVPIPWGALSGLAADADGSVYSVHDSFYRESRVYTLDTASAPATITAELPLVDSRGVLQGALKALKLQLPGTDNFDPSSAVNANGTVNLDLEGIALGENGSFWVASEGTGNLDAGVSDPDDQPFELPNLLARVGADGVILEVVLPPLEVTQNQLRFGFEGVVASGDQLYVAHQRAWGKAGDPSDRARIARYDRHTGTWTYAYYPLDTPTSPVGGWVGLSELSDLGDGELAVIERDNQGGPDAAIKRVTRFSLRGVNFQSHAATPNFDVVQKSLVVDLLAADVYGPGGGPIPEKQEGLAVLPNGSLLVVNDNDGVDDNNGETRLVELDGLLD